MYLESQTDDEVVLHMEVTDTGIGISPDKLELILNRSRRQTPPQAQVRRFGIGPDNLSTHLVRMMGGRILVESHLDQEEFVPFHRTIRPFQITARADDEIVQANLLDLQVLVVDNAASRWILREMLSNWGMRPYTVDSSSAALKELHGAVRAGTPFPLVISDGHMPETDGFMLAETIRNTPNLASTVIVMLTSANQTGDVARCENLGIHTISRNPSSSRSCCRRFAEHSERHCEVLNRPQLRPSMRPRFGPTSHNAPWMCCWPKTIP